ncbi:MAG: leucine-rich repeat domain-containing protein [Bacteroidia bacterium]|nr:leucine-rich repeat domain-containing protein [Bacteroidia bacterium]
MKILSIIALVCFALNSNAQNLLSDEVLRDQKTYTSISLALANKDSVFKLDLSKKKLKEFPKEILALYNLQELHLDRNKIKNVPPQISKLTQLQVLSISKNKLESLPDEIGDLKYLKKLDLNRNLIETIPETIGGLAELEILEMWDNELSNIPDELAYLTNLQVLELRGILFSVDEQARIKDMVPSTAKVYFSPACNCKP